MEQFHATQSLASAPLPIGESVNSMSIICSTYRRQKMDTFKVQS